MNNTIETNQSYQKFKEILTARHYYSVAKAQHRFSVFKVVSCQYGFFFL